MFHPREKKKTSQKQPPLFNGHLVRHNRLVIPPTEHIFEHMDDAPIKKLNNREYEHNPSDPITVSSFKIMAR